MIKRYKNELIKIQNEIIDVTKLAVVIVDREGNYITEKGNFSDFCKLFRNNKNLNLLCEKCDMHALNKTFLTLKPYIYRCHSGLVDMIVPILYDNELLGAFIVGQIVLEDEKSFNIQQVMNDNLGKNVDGYKLGENYKQLKRMTFAEITSVANLLSYTSSYITQCIKTRKWSTHKIENNVSDNRICLNDLPIGAAIIYINKNLNGNISLAEAASSCNMSVSQFTRAFKKETGKTFIDFVTRKKIKQAKYLLKYTNKSISEISFELGMDDSSYFTKVFKKYTGIRPKEFRDNILKNQ
ncbi:MULTISPECIES: PocR ligand-binding domain-containing protein [Fusobacterium]|uniref:PocR ligand-binding domain-containing protein n=1 Tax=Fusobacterium TaxID=848 RepID=UPI00147696FF|nr:MULTISPECIES: PocR ligand-binding domain-containing protein [Fusobacterium]NME35859.1 AraC family transcriptional regulator [Fusobacterium sp. FSA-380-WT-3A]